MVNLILCGGSGTRLWPISRALMPKQFVKLFGESSLFQLTVKRNLQICSSHFIVSNADQYFLAVDQLKEIDYSDCKFLLEPARRNTAPAIALACFELNNKDIVLVTPSDHLIKNEKEYHLVIEKAKELANQNNIVTFGIKPTFAETEYGYIEADSIKSFDVKAFHEKPDIITAKKYFESGNYFWNSGIFIFKAGVFLEELKKHAPTIYKTAFKAFENSAKGPIIRIKHDDMQNIPNESIDYAVMEKSEKVKFIKSDIGWSDVGSFDALYEELPKNKDGNTTNANHISINSSNNLIFGSNRTISTVDVKDLIIADTGDALLISKKGSNQKVKKVLEKIKKSEKDLHNIHLTVHRPWGTYTMLEEQPGYKIKRIEVKPGFRLSLQKHAHRNEHWIVLSGTALVTIDDVTKELKTNESTYIKMGQIHRLSNEGKIPLVIIEAQVGKYTGEDDIVRISDDFERNL